MPDTLTVTRLLTAKSDIGRTRIETTPQACELGEGEILLRVDRFSLSANNMTYAALGETMKFWQFFRSPHAEWGHMPVWGFADVVASAVEGIELGERLYGFLPIATHVYLRPERLTQRGFYDGTEHRSELPCIYNQYTRCAADPVYLPELENIQALLRPLFIMSFMLADFLQDNAFFGARRVMVSSASSKTAFGTAFCLDARNGICLTGLTSAKNADFVQTLGCYDETVTYDGIATVDDSVPSIYVDFSGDAKLRALIHAHFGENLLYDCFAGSTANTEFLKDDPDLPGPKPIFFFVATQIKKRSADWGAAELNRRIADAQKRFFTRAAAPANPMISGVEQVGFESAQEIIASLSKGEGNPRECRVVSLQPGVLGTSTHVPVAHGRQLATRSS
jgi:Protein of unknown function (DUF2855)